MAGAADGGQETTKCRGKKTQPTRGGVVANRKRSRAEGVDYSTRSETTKDQSQDSQTLGAEGPIARPEGGA